MLKKPDTCKPCPLYGDGQGFVPDEIIPGAEVMIVMQGPGDEEERTGMPACGKTGQDMNDRFIPLAGLIRSNNVHEGRLETTRKVGVETGSPSVGNILKCRSTGPDGRKTNDLPTGRVLTDAMDHCTRTYLRIPAETKLIVSQGGLAFNYFTGGGLKKPDGKPAGVHDYRGYLLPQPYYIYPQIITHVGGLPTEVTTIPIPSVTIYQVLHIADLYRDPRMWWVSEMDWKKIPKILKGEWPKQIPVKLSYNDATEQQWANIQASSREAQKFYLDTEYDQYTGEVWLIGIGWEDKHKPGGFTGIQYWCNEQASLHDNLYHSTFRAEEVLGFNRFLLWLKKICTSKNVILQNAPADYPKLNKLLGIQYNDWYRIDDLMLKHAAYVCELPHTLEFIDSIHGDYGKLKALQTENPSLYNWGDVLSTWTGDIDIDRALDSDAGARQAYEVQLRPTFHILEEAHTYGIRVDKQRLWSLYQEWTQVASETMSMAAAYCGWPINLASDDHIRRYCYSERGYDVILKKKTKNPTVDEDAIATLREQVGPPFDPGKELTIDLQDGDYYAITRRIDEGADPILECRVLNATVQHRLDTYVYGLTRSVYHARSDTAKKKARAACKVNNTLLRHDLVDRIYPDHAMHVQRTARISTTNPAIATLPSDLRDIIIPDEHECWVTWDWSAIEPRILAAITGSKLLDETFEKGWDLHLWTVCNIFGYENPLDLNDTTAHTGSINKEWRQRYDWKGKDDPRRVFAKSARFEMWYGGTGSVAASSAARFGLNRRTLKDALQKLATSDPDYYRWRTQTTNETKRQRIIRDFSGAPRRLLDRDKQGKVSQNAIRAALDYPMQRGASTIFYKAIRNISESNLPLRFVWSMHDRQDWRCLLSDLDSQLLTDVKKIVEGPYMINGKDRYMPAEIHVIYPLEYTGVRL